MSEESDNENEESGSGSGEGESDEVDDKTKNTNQKQEAPKQETSKQEPIKQEPTKQDQSKKGTSKILFNKEKITQYWQDQKPPKKGLFIDNSFPPIAESLYDKKMKNEGVEKMNIYQIDWRKSTELFKKKDFT